MPGVVAMVAIAQGQAVKAGDLLITLEAMKIETAISVPKEATISEIAAKTGQPIDAKKLLVVLD
ncbi:biotin/lipoyl-binding protein [Sphingobium sp. H39-3-25]|nr:biotin/lipoyl-containing protein [Novosphingobium naphthalenivorans]MDF0546086.1 biotin/lipoyl-binding protein [Sphingobium arseniciresistens]